MDIASKAEALCAALGRLTDCIDSGSMRDSELTSEQRLIRMALIAACTEVVDAAKNARFEFPLCEMPWCIDDAACVTEIGVLCADCARENDIDPKAHQKRACEFEGVECDKPVAWSVDIGGGCSYLCDAHKDECEKANRADGREVEYHALTGGVS